jgi:hypothetical protein
MAYQWASRHPEDQHRLFAHFRAGWKKSKNPAGKLKNRPADVILLEIPKDQYQRFVADGIHRAKEQIEEASKPFGINAGGFDRKSRPFPLVSPSFMVSSDYPKLPAEAAPIEVNVTIKVRASVGWQDAAACLGLSVEEYARRRLLMEPPVLGPSPRFYDDKTYEPVELSFTRKD